VDFAGGGKAADRFAAATLPSVETGEACRPEDRARPARVLFLCTHNSARSQMAEGMLRAWGAGRFGTESAGTMASHVRPEAIEVMRELGIDIAAHESKTVDRFLGEPFDWVITVCDAAKESCPMLPGARRQLHWSIDDPAANDGDVEQRLAAFRRARDELAGRVRRFLAGEGVE
jgi:arsenate reductase